MFKLIVPVCLSLAMISPSFSSGQDCGCDDGYGVCDECCDAGFVKTRKKLALIEDCVEIKRLRRVCETDECGCSRTRLAFVDEPITFKRLGFVDVPVDPCSPSLLDRMREKMSSLSLRNRFGDSACCDDGCGCIDEYNGGQVMDADWGVNGGYDAFQEEHYDAQDQYYETSPRMVPQQPEMLPRSTQPQDIIPRSVTPRSTAPRNTNPRNVAPQGNSNVIESPLGGQGG